jgi:hypothetical protein
MTPDKNKAEDEFREALIKYLRANDALGEDSFLVNWYVITASENMKDSDLSSISAMPSNNNPYAMQLGMVEYVRTWLKADIISRPDDD